jgi:magnesium-transporting ATPase (P-type)
MNDAVAFTPQASAIPPGLTSAEAGRRLAQVGPNATPDAKVHPLRRLLGKFIAPVPCLLEAAIALQLFLGEYIEASVIGFLLVFNAALGVLHEGRAQATIVEVEQDGRRALLRTAPGPTIDPRHPSSRRSRRRRNPADLWCLKLTMR